MKIAHYLSRFRLADGGVVRACIDLGAGLARAGHDVAIHTFDASDLPASWKSGSAPDSPRILEHGRPGGIAGFLPRRALHDIVRAIGSPDVLHLHTPWDPVNLQLARQARKAGLPYVVTAHGMLDNWSMGQKTAKKRLYLALGARAMLERAAAVHCTAQAELDQAKQWFPRGRGVVVPLLFDCSEYRNLPGPDLARRAIPAAAATYEPAILFLSRLHPKKRPEILIDAAKILRDEGRSFRVFIAGSGERDYERELRDRIRAAGLDNIVHLAGLVTGAAKVSLFELAQIFVLPTSQENFGFVYLEALAAGTPVITTRGTDTWRELEESGGAVITPRDDAPTFARELAVLLDDPARAEVMGAKGRRWVFEHFDGDAVLREFETMYAGAERRHH